eukprot:9908723-Alexandrium_andersonii.AAC.1
MCRLGARRGAPGDLEHHYGRGGGVVLRRAQRTVPPGRLFPADGRAAGAAPSREAGQRGGARLGGGRVPEQGRRSKPAEARWESLQGAG